MVGGRIQKLLTGEYSEFEDVVLLDAPFVEITKLRRGIRQVYIGITKETFVVAVEHPLDYKKYPQVYTQTNADLDLCGVELDWLVPLCFVKITSRSAFCLNVECEGRPTRYFEMNTNVARNMVWPYWIYRITLLRDDSYGTNRELRIKYGIATQEDTDYLHEMTVVNKVLPNEEPQAPKDSEEGFLKSLQNCFLHIRNTITLSRFTKKPAPYEHQAGSILKSSHPHNRHEHHKHHVKFERSMGKKFKDLLNFKT